MESIYEKIVLREWTHPATNALADSEFVEKAKLKWGQNRKDDWILVGEWLDNRPDIVSWIRNAYWRSHKQKWIGGAEHEGYLEPWRVADSQEANNPGDEVSVEAAPASPTVSNEKIKSWKDVMLL